MKTESIVPNQFKKGQKVFNTDTQKQLTVISDTGFISGGFLYQPCADSDNENVIDDYNTKYLCPIVPNKVESFAATIVTKLDEYAKGYDVHKDGLPTYFPPAVEAMEEIVMVELQPLVDSHAKLLRILIEVKDSVWGNENEWAKIESAIEKAKQITL